MKTLTPSRLATAVAAAALGSMLAAATATFANDDDKGGKGNDFSTRLSSYNEVHFSGAAPATLRGAISSKASGSFRLKIDESSPPLIHYELTYQDLDTAVAQAHIHFGQRHTVGGIVVWLCQGTVAAPGSVSALTPTCPLAPGGTVTGTIQASQVLAQTEQGIIAGDFDALLRAIRAGATYANVHTVKFGPGEIRGQIRKGGGHGKGK